MNFSSIEFIDKLKSRDSLVITQLVDQYHEALFKGAIKQGLASDQAEVVVQNTWGTFFEQIERFEGRSHIRTYLFGIMYNKAKETFRENKKYTGDYDESALEKIFTKEGSYDSPPKSPENWMQSNEFFIILGEELKKLPENQRVAFTLKEIEGESTQDICNILGVSNTNLGVLIYRAKNNLRLALEKSLNK
jgi:RNA polymerase sigma-70 factor (ECF subfamily)